MYNTVLTQRNCCFLTVRVCHLHFDNGLDNVGDDVMQKEAAVGNQ